jgi:ATP-dependent helicase HrpA
MSEKDLVLAAPDPSELAFFPDTITAGGRTFPAVYRFTPGDADDGVTIRIPSPYVAVIPAEVLEWGVPGYFREKIEALIKGLLKAYRKQLMPFSEKAEIIIREMKPTEPSLYGTLAKFVKQRFQVDIPVDEWAKVEIPAHLKTRVAITDHAGREIAAGRNLDELRRAAAPSAMPEDSAEWKAARARWERQGLTSWDVADIPESIQVGHFLVGFLGFEPGEQGVNIRLFKTREEALTAHEHGVEALLAMRFAKDIDFLRRYLVLPEDYENTALYFGGRSAFEKAMQDHLRREIFRRNLRSKPEFEAYAETVMRALFEKSHQLRETVEKILDVYQKTHRLLQDIEKAGRSNRAVTNLCTQLRDELQKLVPSDFLEIYSLNRLAHLPRYLNALQVRAERGKIDPEKDRKKAEQVGPFLEALQRLEKEISAETSRERKPAIDEFRWMIEEFKVSLFAPELRTAFPISAKRLNQKIIEIKKGEE